ncbi:putative S-adenosyl-L-methionine-dependent methyltransferase [Mycolicibacterium madagascariense]|uniref:S-adenosyl-L-methionine-dependent methyltransferase n=1 Tax=Mycolicibacterium madagascariense TaxID=212765 RepID=A0A7I7X7Z9_9MYCO|nr:class I SAM-dependent methyltransferase [Mycolicibacterium madagascariense]MCV7014197.1 class I SAM-dependent methyltransferase [Mycolicibacterium madagascariense]BBZ25806.1 putative S-adenosyl-L-methionine-dependent methyltransferase [Mycolicibacterium madagascariense]
MTNSNSPRFEGDNWDLASGVGVTATAVAAQRALASKGPNPLIDDAYAEPLVTSVGIDVFIQLMNGDVQLVDDPAYTAQRLNEGTAVTTRYFDGFFLQAAHAGVRQAVILASGLDTRAYRLPWPTGVVLYEIDQPRVVEFKTRTLAELGVAPTVEHSAVGVDLRDDWPDALHDHGFDSTQPTAWIAEGLLDYLPPQTQDRLFDAITTLSAPGSRIATGYVPDTSDRVQNGGRKLDEGWRQLGLNINWPDLIYTGDRNDAATYLSARGWHTTVRTTSELYADNGFDVPEAPSMLAFGDIKYVSAIRE